MSHPNLPPPLLPSRFHLCHSQPPLLTFRNMPPLSVNCVQGFGAFVLTPPDIFTVVQAKTFSRDPLFPYCSPHSESSPPSLDENPYSSIFSSPFSFFSPVTVHQNAFPWRGTGGRTVCDALLTPFIVSLELSGVAGCPVICIGR